MPAAEPIAVALAGGDAAAADTEARPAEGEGASRRRRGRRGGRRRRKNGAEAGAALAAGEHDHDDALDAAPLVANGSQPEFDFDDAPVTVALIDPRKGALEAASGNASASATPKLFDASVDALSVVTPAPAPAPAPARPAPASQASGEDAAIAAIDAQYPAPPQAALAVPASEPAQVAAETLVAVADQAPEAIAPEVAAETDAPAMPTASPEVEPVSTTAAGIAAIEPAGSEPETQAPGKRRGRHRQPGARRTRRLTRRARPGTAHASWRARGPTGRAG